MRTTTTNESAGGKKTLLHLGFLDQSCGIGIGFAPFFFFFFFGLWELRMGHRGSLRVVGVLLLLLLPLFWSHARNHIILSHITLVHISKYWNRRACSWESTHMVWYFLCKTSKLTYTNCCESDYITCIWIHMVYSINIKQELRCRWCPESLHSNLCGWSSLMHI